ncbi:Maf family protein [Salinimonas sediminis]|uniref:7-methyl-GTP pyrophosphatase n=1 Tax=Salinimonas sediminis TaxID=2303538 RepID=A0A346NL87_9ALTE|nr:Maf family protein [Salinimonas sediminis]AXR06294.1 septum formation protein Maf [Salinimonas sediminis]
MTAIILASSSRYRQALLAGLGIQAQAIAPDIDETPLPGEEPWAVAARLACAKASKIGSLHPHAITIGSDQVAVLYNKAEEPRLLGKPGTFDKAVEQLTACAGNQVTFYTALCVYSPQHGPINATDTTVVHFKPLSQAAIQAYVEHEQPLDCAGSFKCEGVGALLFERIEGRDPNSLIGLPVMLLRDLLAKVNIDLLALATSKPVNRQASGQ